MNKAIQKVGRNSLCPCGSGLKYKKCCFLKETGSQKVLNNRRTDLFDEAQHYFRDGRYAQAIKCYQDILAGNRNHIDAMHYLGIALFQLGDHELAMEHLSKSLSLRPGDAFFQNNMGMVLEENEELAEAEVCYRNALQIDSKNTEARFNLAKLLLALEKNNEATKILAKLAEDVPDDLQIRDLYAESLESNQQAFEAIQVCEEILAEFPDRISTKIIYGSVIASTGRFEEAEKIYRQLCELDQSNRNVWQKRIWWAESQNNLDFAEQLVNEFLALPDLDEPARFGAYRQKATLLRHRESLSESKLWMEKIDPEKLSASDKMLYYGELGQIFEKQKKYSDAFIAYKNCNELRTEYFSVSYSREQEIRNFARLKTVFTDKNITEWKKNQRTPPQIKSKPLFVLGFMRSGTSLVEQILAVHNNISAGGELNFLGAIEEGASKLLNSSLPFPECMLTLSSSTNPSLLETFSSMYYRYLNNYELAGNNSSWVTDKAPLNSIRLGVINLLFPSSPVLHTIRHPLDVCLSTYFTNFRNGHWYSLDIEDTAFYFNQVFELVEHYKKNIPGLNYLPVKYEDLLQEPEQQVRRILNFIGEPYDERCLEFYKSKRVVRTASYAQVNKKLYTSSMYRYKNYRKQIEPIIPVLMPAIESLGYTVE